jgi:hypothetical protein
VVGFVPGEAFVTSLNGGRLPFIFCAGTLAPRVTAPEWVAFFGSIFGRVKGLKDETDGPRDNGLPKPPGCPAAPPTRCCMFVAGLTKSRERPFSGAGKTPFPVLTTAMVLV